MTTDTKNLLFFLTGVSIGAAGTWLLLRKKFQREKQAEMTELRQTFARKEADLQKREEELLSLVRKNDEEKGSDILEYMARKKEFEEIRQAYMKQVSELGYSGERTVPEGAEYLYDDFETGPYVITPREFGERDGYDTISFTYFDDGVLADELGDEMSPEEIENTIGLDALTHFGEYEEDSVYVRNERRRCDYSILLDSRDFHKFLETRPLPMVMEEL